MAERPGPSQRKVRADKLTLREEGRVVERNFDVLRTHLPNVYALVDHGADPDYRRSTVRKLRTIGNAYFARAETIKQLLSLQEEPHDELIQIADEYDVRGYRDLQAGIEVQINPTTESIFDERLLGKSLGDRGPDYVHKTVTVTVELDADNDDVGRFVASVRRRFAKRGMTAEEIDHVVKVKKTLRVDEKALQKMIEKGEITLFHGAWQIRRGEWKVVPRRIRTLAELAEAEEGLKVRGSANSPLGPINVVNPTEHHVVMDGDSLGDVDSDRVVFRGSGVPRDRKMDPKSQGHSDHSPG